MAKVAGRLKRQRPRRGPVTTPRVRSGGRDGVAVHKDFHGAMSYGVQFLTERYGWAEAEAYLRRMARAVYKPLVARIKARGLSALRDHWRRIFALEGGRFALRRQGPVLELRVEECPAVCHMKKHDYAIADRFCETTRVVNEEICRAAGCECSVEYDQAKGRCVQRFWTKPNRRKRP